MLGVMLFGIVGGIVGAVVALPYGYDEALVAYCLSGSLFFIIPSVLGELRSHEPAGAIVQGRSPSP